MDSNGIVSCGHAHNNQHRLHKKTIRPMFCLEEYRVYDYIAVGLSPDRGLVLGKKAQKHRS